MIAFDGIYFNEPASGMIMAELVLCDPAYGKIGQNQVADRVSRISFMSAVAKLNGLAFFPRVAGFVDRRVLARCNAGVMTHHLFAPLCFDGRSTLIVAIANPWSPLPGTYLAPRFPGIRIVRIVAPVPEIVRAIESGTRAGISHPALEAATP